MDTSRGAVIEPASANQSSPAEKRQYRSSELKRKIVEESLVPGASVARIARAYGVNANLVFTWRRRYRQGLFAAVKNGKSQTPGLLAVRVTPPQEMATALPSAPIPTSPSGTIEIELAKGTIRIRGSADVGVLRTALGVLAR